MTSPVCPGGSLSACVGMCPATPPDAYTNCVDECTDLCSTTPIDLPYSYSNDWGPFHMTWGFVGSGSNEVIEIEFSLPAEAWGGIGLGCETSRQCDMVIGSGCALDGVFVTDYWEEVGSAIPHTDVSLGGTEDIELISASCVNYFSIVRFRRKLNTGDRWDAVLSKGSTPLIYSWCEPPWCEDLESPHELGAWEITSVDLSGRKDLNSATVSHFAEATLPYSYSNPRGPFKMSWGFSGTGSQEVIEIEFTLPAEAWGGIGLGCTTSRKCDMVVGSACAAGGVFVNDYWEEKGSVEPHTDVSLGGSDDIELISGKCVNYQSTIRFRRKLNTGDRWDAILKKGSTPLIYSWCEPPWCTDIHSPHEIGAWEITNVDLSGRKSTDPIWNRIKHSSVDARTANMTSTCYAGSEDLCGCSELIRRGAIENFDECTQAAAIDYCEEFGPCY